MDIDIAMVNKLYDLAVMQPEVPVSLKEHYLSLQHHAGECVGCRGCESRCPFGVKVVPNRGTVWEITGAEYGPGYWRKENKHYICLLFQFKTITAERIRRIPSPERKVRGSEKTRIPTSVATIGSMVAIIPALLASTVRRPIV